VLEYVARVPCQAWERMCYLALARHRRRSALARRIFGRIVQTAPSSATSSGTY
jgi:ubiquinol oxidase